MNGLVGSSDAPAGETRGAGGGALGQQPEGHSDILNGPAFFSIAARLENNVPEQCA